MGEAIRFEIRSFGGFLDGFAKRFRLPGELMREPREAEAAALTESLLALEGSLIEHFARRLKGRELETLIFASARVPDGEAADRINEALRLRMSKRLVKLIWALFQLNYDREKLCLKQLAADAAEFSARTGLDIPEAEMLAAVNGTEPVGAVKDFIRRSEISINAFAEDYELIRDARFLFEVARAFFLDCPPGGYVLNEGWFLRVIEGCGIAEVVPVVCAYITAFAEGGYVQSANEAILNKMGYPFSSDNWSHVPDVLRRRFADWCFMREMKIFFVTNKKKYALLSSYIAHMKEVKTLEAEMLVIDFGEFVIVDDDEGAEFSFFCSKKFYESRVLSVGGEKLSIKYEKLAEAKNYIIDESEEELLRLNYQDVGKLYIKEMLDIMLGLISDTRTSKSLVAAKRRRKSGL